HAWLGQYLRKLERPLWNPYQGLGEPYAAQGDGSPYSPFEVVRAIVPYSWVTALPLAAYYFSAVFLFLFLRELGLTEGAAVVGAHGVPIIGRAEPAHCPPRVQ